MSKPLQNDYMDWQVQKYQGDALVAARGVMEVLEGGEMGDCEWGALFLRATQLLGSVKRLGDAITELKYEQKLKKGDSQ